MTAPLSPAELERFIRLQTPGPFDHDWHMPGPPIALDLSLPDQRVALIGDRGSGKTTLLRWLAATAPESILLLDDVNPAEAEARAAEYPGRRIFATTTKAIPGFITREILPFTQSDIRAYLQK
jgi:ATPase subunit of ABC transporter with duplicated ATPase domains